jgi:hypothetical protein
LLGELARFKSACPARVTITVSISSSSKEFSWSLTSAERVCPPGGVDGFSSGDASTRWIYIPPLIKRMLRRIPINNFDPLITPPREYLL